MFGYVMINPDTLTDAEKQRFREVYCGVCASLRERGGRPGADYAQLRRGVSGAGAQRAV